jgi:REP element-mobilizing transposase RayT
MRHRLFVHLIWTTRERQALIDARVAGFLDGFLRDVARQERARVLAIGMVQSHVHLLVRVHPQTDLTRLVQRLKGGSAALAGKEGHSSRTSPLRWARGYSIDSVSHRAVEIVRDYVLSQPTHPPAEAIPRWPQPRSTQPR